MKKLPLIVPILLLFVVALSGCGTMGEKAASISIIYGIMAVCSLLLLIGYCYLAKKRDFWFLLLFFSVLIVNIGYTTLSISRTLEEALLSNRIAYFGSVFLPLSMLMIILNVCNIRFQKWVPGILLTISIFIFLIAASPGYLDIYYKEVSLEIINGVSYLHKVYGPCHSLYYFYLFGYFGAMIGAIFYSTTKHKLESTGHVIILIVAVFVNIGVWFIEQFAKIDFEVLSVSYIISELFLLGLDNMIQENACINSVSNVSSTTLPDASCEVTKNVPIVIDSELKERLQYFLDGAKTLTPTEHSIYNFYLEHKTTKEIMETLNIKENTLKFHNKNIYSKLGVSSRKQLMEIYQILHAENHL